MSNKRFGIWLIGAQGGVATTAIAGSIALGKGLADNTGVVSTLPQFAHLPLPNWDQFVFGGHEIRQTTLYDEAVRLHRESRIFDQEMLTACRPELEQVDENICPGILWNVGPTIRQLATREAVPAEAGPREAVEQIQADIQDFRQRHKLDGVVVVNLSSTEALLDEAAWPTTWSETQQLLDHPECPLPASSIYAIAALDLGFPYINFTPSLGATPTGIDSLARQRGTCHAGRDGKTGETLLKSVLAPMFAARNLDVMSWVGHNIFGNLDSKVLDDPENKAAKVSSKDRLLSDILGKSPETLVSIERIASLGDWKTAWDHIHFRGFLGTPMTLQLTWQGCDSALAAPLVLDLVRFTLLAHQQGETGPLTFLSSFFKSPIGTCEQAFSEQLGLLNRWAQNL